MSADDALGRLIDAVADVCTAMAQQAGEMDGDLQPFLMAWTEGLLAAVGAFHMFEHAPVGHDCSFDDLIRDGEDLLLARALATGRPVVRR